MRKLILLSFILLLIGNISAFSISYSPSAIVKTLNVNKDYCREIWVGGDWKTATLSTDLKNLKITGEIKPNVWNKVCINPLKKGKYNGYLYVTTNVDENSRFRAGIRLKLNIL